MTDPDAKFLRSIGIDPREPSTLWINGQPFQVYDGKIELYRAGGPGTWRPKKKWEATVDEI